MSHTLLMYSVSAGIVLRSSVPQGLSSLDTCACVVAPTPACSATLQRPIVMPRVSSVLSTIGGQTTRKALFKKARNHLLEATTWLIVSDYLQLA